MYTTESCTTSIAVSDYKKRYIDIPTFTEYCKACPNYDRLWSCPSYTFDVEAFWNQFQTLDLFAVKIIYNDNYAGKQFSEHKIADIMRQSLNVEKARMSQALFRLEEKFPGSVSLSAGSCSLCHDNCTRPDGLPCRYPDKLRYSIESLGGNVGPSANAWALTLNGWKKADCLTTLFLSAACFAGKQPSTPPITAIHSVYSLLASPSCH